MRSCFIIGAGRSGTSLTAALLRKEGYYYGEDIIPENPDNPIGYYESWDINNLNEIILSNYLPQRPFKFLSNIFFQSRLAHGHRWLAKIDEETNVISSEKDVLERIDIYLRKQRFCYKDPRFSFTLPVWLSRLPSTLTNKIVIICLVRNPLSSTKSMVRKIQKDTRRRNIILKFDENDALESWKSSYKHILKNFKKFNDLTWLFVNYEDLLNNDSFGELENALNTSLDKSIIDPNLNHSTSSELILDNEASMLYEKLISLTKTSNLKSFNI